MGGIEAVRLTQEVGRSFAAAADAGHLGELLRRQPVGPRGGDDDARDGVVAAPWAKRRLEPAVVVERPVNHVQLRHHATSKPCSSARIASA